MLSSMTLRSATFGPLTAATAAWLVVFASGEVEAQVRPVPQPAPQAAPQPVPAPAPGPPGLAYFGPQASWGFTVSFGGGYGVGYFESGGGLDHYVGFFHGGMVHATLGIASAVPPDRVGRTGFGIVYDFQAMVDSSGMIHHHTVGIELLGSFLVRAGLGLMAISSFGDGGEDYLGFAGTIAVGYAFELTNTFSLSLELPVMMDVFVPGDSVVAGFATGLQLGFNYF